MSPLRGSSYATLPGSCGYGIIYHHGWGGNRLITNVPGGTGTAIAAFTNEPRCKVVYDWIVENCTILYQSQVKRNRNSGNQNFLVVFEAK
jgi:hypothetical protein